MKNASVQNGGSPCAEPDTFVEKHPLGTQAHVLLTGVFGPFAHDDEFGSRRINPMELYHNQVTREQGPFSIRMFNRNWGLMLIRENISARCALLEFPSLERFTNELKRTRYDIVGISAILVNFGKVKKMCELVRQYQPETTIVVGGHVANLENLDRQIDADHIVRGEGVRWFRRFLGEDESRPVRHIMSYVGFGQRALGSAASKTARRAAAVLIPSVGCPVGCNFCSTSAMFGGKGRFVNFIETGEELFATMQKVEKTLGTKEFMVMDENFLIHRSRAMRLLELMERHDKAWGLSLFSSAKTLRLYSMDQLVRMGVSRVWIGLEGENSRYEKMNGIDTRQLVRDLQSHGISVMGSSIVGLEEHTLDNIDSAIAYAISHDADFHQFMLYMPLPGTPLYRDMAAQGNLLSPKEAPFADRHGQYRFAHRHPHLPPGSETGCLTRAFQKDFEFNGPSVLRAIRTNFLGWKRYRNDPRPRIRLRYARRARSLPTAQAGAIWAGLRWFQDNMAVHEKLSEVLRDIHAEFGWKSKFAAPIAGRIVLQRLRREDALLKKGWTYEPKAIFETGAPTMKPARKGLTQFRMQEQKTNLGIARYPPGRSSSPPPCPTVR